MKRKVPAILVAAFALDILFSLANVGVQLFADREPNWDRIDRWWLVENGAWMMTLVLITVGLRDLADRVWGTANRMAKLASALAMAMLFTEIVFMLINAFELASSRTFWSVQSYIFWGEGVALLVVLFLGGERKGLAIAGLVLGLVARLPPFAAQPMWDALALGYRGAMSFRSVLSIAHTVGTLLLVMSIVPGTPAHVPQRAVAGLRHAGSGFTLRIVAAVGAMVLVLLAIGSNGEGLVKFVLIAGLFVNMLASAMIGLGALDAARASVEGLAKPVLIVSAAGSLWCAGAMFNQLPHYYQLLYGSHHGRDALEALSLALPIVGALATAVLATAIGGLGRTRGDAALAQSGTASGVTYLALTLAAIAMQNYMIEHVHSKGGVLGLLLLAAGAGLAAQIVMGRLCRRAAEAIASQPGLPSARVNA